MTKMEATLNEEAAKLIQFHSKKYTDSAIPCKGIIEPRMTQTNKTEVLERAHCIK